MARDEIFFPPLQFVKRRVTHHSIVSEFKLSGSWWKLAESSTLELTSANTSLSTVLPSNDHIWDLEFL